MCQVFLSECHPETRAADRRKVFDQAFQLLMIHQVGFPWADFRVMNGLMNRQGVGFFPYAILVIFSPLGNLADIDFRIEIGCESLMVVSGVAIHNVEVLYLVKMMLRGVGGIDARHARVETASQNCRQPCFPEFLLISPLPTIFIFSLVQRFIVCRIQIADTVLQARVHDRQILVRQSQVDYQIRLEGPEQRNEFVHLVGIHLSCLYLYVFNVGGNLVTFTFCTAG